MAKANKKVINVNKKPTNVKQMNTDFDGISATLSGVAVGTEEIMPLFSASLKLSIRILNEYQKAFNAGTKYAKK